MRSDGIAQWISRHTDVTHACNNQGLPCQSLNAWGNVGLAMFDIHGRVITCTDANNVTATNRDSALRGDFVFSAARPPVTSTSPATGVTRGTDPPAPAGYSPIAPSTV